MKRPRRPSSSWTWWAAPRDPDPQPDTPAIQACRKGGAIAGKSHKSTLDRVFRQFERESAERLRKAAARKEG